jgi:hypothetical protein
MAVKADPFKSFEAMLPIIIAEAPSQVMRRREVAADTFRDPQVYTAGPYTVRIEPYNSRSTGDVWDEKGQVATQLFQLVGHSLPKTVRQNGEDAPLFKLDDRITDQDGNVYRVAGAPFHRGKVVQVLLALRG